MSRSDYTDDAEDQWAFIRWRGQVASAIRGKRGQKLLRDMLESLEGMPEKRLIRHALVREAPPFIPPSDASLETGVCALGALGRARALPMDHLDPKDYRNVAKAFDIAEPLEREITYINDEQGPYHETAEQRYVRVRRWVQQHIGSSSEKQNVP